MKRAAIVISIIVILVIIGSVFYFVHLQSSTTSVATNNSGWKSYESSADGLSFEYPSTFAIDKQDNNGYSILHVIDPKNHAVYVSIMLVNDPSSQSNINELFTGPYPKEIPPTSNDSTTTVVQKVLNGLRGVEEYNYIQEGGSYSDVFLYKGNHLWEIYLDPVLEGRVAAYPEPTTPVPDKDTYERILGSIKISS